MVPHLQLKDLKVRGFGRSDRDADEVASFHPRIVKPSRFWISSLIC